MPLTTPREPSTAATPALQGTYIQLLIRGLVAGLIAGLLAGAVAFVLGEPHIDSAIALEEAAGEHAHTGVAEASHSHDEEEALVSRDGQRAGLFLATGLAGLALGAVFASVLHYARRFTTLSGSALALVAAGLGWAAIEAVPFFKYPANPPAVGDPDTIAQRTWLWLAAVVLGIAAVAAGIFVSKIVATRDSLGVRVGAPAAAFVLVVIAGYLLLPSISEVGEDFPATLLWDFRIASLATQASLWVALGVVFALLTDRASFRGR